DVADLTGEVPGHEVGVVGEVLPCATVAQDLGLAAVPSFGFRRARYSGDLVGEGRELVDHGVDGVLEFEDLALDVDGDLLREVTEIGRASCREGVEDLAGQV